MMKERVMSLVMPHRDALVQCVLEGWQEYVGLPAERRAHLTRTARAIVVHCNIIKNLSLRFGTDGAIRVVEFGLLRYLSIDGQKFAVGLRAKKLDRNLRTSNAQTLQQQTLAEQLLMPWADVETIHAILGYTLTDDEIEPSVSGVWLTQEDQQGVLWSECLWSAAEQGAVPAGQQEPEGPLPAAVVRPKAKEPTSQERVG